MASPLLRRAGTVAAVLATGAAAWEVQRRVDARRIAADPEHAELSRRIDGTPVAVRSEDGTRLHAEVFGPEDAPVVVLVHGWICTLDFWHYQIRDLSKEFRVVAYDQRGHGRSDRPGSGEYSKNALAADLQAVLDTCVGRGRRCVVAGHSMGGMTVVAWAARHATEVRDRLSGAMLIDTGMGDLVAQSNLVPFLHGGRLRTVLGAWFLTAPVRPQRTSTPLSYRGVRWASMGPGASPARVAFCERIVMGCPTAVRTGFGREISTLDLYEGVPSLTVPTVVMVGEVDRLTPPWHSRRLADTLPRVVELVELPGIGHNTPVEAPDEVTRRLRDLARAGAGSQEAVATG